MRSASIKKFFCLALAGLLFPCLTAFTVSPKQISSGQLTFIYQAGKKKNQQTIRTRKDPFAYVLTTKSKFDSRQTKSREYSDQHYWYHQNDQGKWVKVAKPAPFAPSGHLLDPDDFSQLLWDLQPQASWRRTAAFRRRQKHSYAARTSSKKLLGKSQSLFTELAPQAGKLRSLTWRWQLTGHRVKKLTYVADCQHGRIQLIFSHLNAKQIWRLPKQVEEAPIQSANEGRG